MKSNRPVIGIVLDGFGCRNEKEGNPVKVAEMPFYKTLLKFYQKKKGQDRRFAVTANAAYSLSLNAIPATP